MLRPLAASMIMIGLASSARAQSLDLQAKCSAEARNAFQEYSAEDKADSAKLGISPPLSFDYESHYNTKINRCLILTEKMWPAGKQTSTAINLWDANERRSYGSWLWTSDPVKKYWEVRPIACELVPNYKDKKNCSTKEEFDGFVASYMEE